jgi:hypothetical protein
MTPISLFIIHTKNDFEVATTNNSSSLFINHIKELMNCRASRLQKGIYDEMSSFQRITIQNRQRSSSSTATKHTIGVSPEPHLDLICNPFDTRQWNHLSIGKRNFTLR